MTIHAQEKAQKRLEKTLCLYLGIDNNKNSNQQTLGEGENLIFRVTTLLRSNVQCSQQKNIGHTKNRNKGSLRRKKINRNCP